MTARGTVLLVDDEEKILKTLGRALRDDGHEVTAVSHPAEGLRLATSRPVDVLVVDNRCPTSAGSTSSGSGGALARARAARRS
jgi:diguanylate cyclase